MLKPIYAPKERVITSGVSIFLAGPSPRKETDYNWRPEALNVLKNLGFKGTVYLPIPSDGNWTEDYNDQIIWETTYLHRATVIAFWIPRDLETLPGFTTNVEFGMYASSGKIVLGFPENAPKMRYLEAIARMNKVPVCTTLEETMSKAIDHSRHYD